MFTISARFSTVIISAPVAYSKKQFYKNIETLTHKETCQLCAKPRRRHKVSFHVVEVVALVGHRQGGRPARRTDGRRRRVGERIVGIQLTERCTIVSHPYKLVHEPFVLRMPE